MKIEEVLKISTRSTSRYRPGKGLSMTVSLGVFLIMILTGKFDIALSTADVPFTLFLPFMIAGIISYFVGAAVYKSLSRSHGKKTAMTFETIFLVIGFILFFVIGALIYFKIEHAAK